MLKMPTPEQLDHHQQLCSWLVYSSDQNSILAMMGKLAEIVKKLKLCENKRNLLSHNSQFTNICYQQFVN